MISTVYTGDHSGEVAPSTPGIPPRPSRPTRVQVADLLALMQVWHDAGCAVHPAKSDGSKMPVSVRGGSPDLESDTFPDTYQSGQWAGSPHPRAGQPNPDAGQHRYGWGRIASGDLPRLTPGQIAAQVRAGRSDGIGVFCGLASGGLEMVEVEGRARDLLAAIRAAADRLGVLHLLERLAAGCVEESPSGGVHFVLRVTDGPALGNTVLAARPDPAAEHGRQVLAETRGQGGWFVCAPSAGRTHKSGKPYRMLRGGPATIPGFTVAERDALYAAFRAVDEMPAVVPTAAPAAQVQRRDRPAGDILPGDDFNQRATWDEILTGWKRGQVVGERLHWTRPGKEHGTSATTTTDVLCCYSSSAGLPMFTGAGCKHALSKFATFAHLNHAGDFAAAARDLWNKGYGSRAQDDRDGDDQDDGGSEPAPVEPRPAPGGSRRTLDDWRREAADRRAAAISQPGLHLDRSPTGSGKTHATIVSLTTTTSSVTALPTHANVLERVQEMQLHGIDAVAYPELSSDNCQRFDDATRAQSLGLAAGAAVCPGCPFNRVPNPRYPGRKPDGDPEPRTLPGPCHNGDQYQGLMQAARDAAHAVGTQERMRRSSKMAEGSRVVVIDECPETVLAPTITVPVGNLAKVDHLAHGIQNYWHSEANPDQKSFARAMQEVIAAIHAVCAGITTAGVVQVDLRLGRDVPDRWQRLLFDSVSKVGVGKDLNPEALMLVTRAAAGELDRLQVVTDLTARGRLVHFVVGSWRPDLPADAAVMMLDATADRDDVALVAGQPVDDCTPDGHLPLHAPVVQIATDISRGTAASAVAGQIEAFLAANPQVQRLGVIGHKPHLVALFDGEELPAAARERVAKSCWFGQGPDRASNDWHQTCDHLLVLGTPRANPGDYRRWLVQHGLHDAAGKVDGDWGPRPWQSVGTDGQPIVVQGRGYRNQDWHRAFVAVCRSTLHQSVGRGRAILPDGIPVTVLTSEPTPYPVAPPLAPLPAAVRETADIVLALGRQQGAGSAKTPIGNPYRENCASGPWRTADCIRAICAAAGIDRRAAQVRLAGCREAGLLANPRKGWWGLPGSEAPQPAVARQAGTTATTSDILPASSAPPQEPPVPPSSSFQPRPAMIQPPPRAVVIAATGPAAAAPPVAVVADCPPTATTATCTSTLPAAAVGVFDDLLHLVDERAAILEFDGGLDRETADRLAREMVLGRDAPTMSAPPDQPIVVAVDHQRLAIRTTPYVDQVLRRIPGTVEPADDHPDPFAGAAPTSVPARSGTCRCGHDDWVQVPIHDGRSIRTDCRHCDRFGWFAVWHGKRQPPPWGDDHDDVVPIRHPDVVLPAMIQQRQQIAPALLSAG
jgi:hypothetical protein